MPKKPEDLLFSKVRDGVSLSQKGPCFLGFLNEEEAALCRRLLERDPDARYLFWGGCSEAERVLLGLFPDYLDPSPELFPIAVLDFSFRKEDVLSHRDFLGAFMALGVERDVVGDILVGEGRAAVFLRREMEEYFLQNLQKIGRVGVRVSSGAGGELPFERKFLTLSGVVASPRLDCLTAFLCKTSREKAAGLIEAGLVLRNHRESLSVSERVSEGDVLSIRKQGKFIIDRLGPMTAKGRLSVQCRKYQ